MRQNGDRFVTDYPRDHLDNAAASTIGVAAHWT
jgi:hypothetical protein